MKYSRIEKNKKKSFSGVLITLVVVVIIAIATIYYFVFNQDEEDTKAVDQQPAVTTPQVPVEEDELVPKPEVDEAGYAIVSAPVTEPTIIDGILIANKQYPLPANYNPGEDEQALAAYKEMEAAAKQAGYKIMAFSSFRSYEYQQTLYEKYIAKDGQENADRYSARPGHSEHQTGLAFDIGEVGREDLWLTEEFGETPAGKWLAENAHNYGFVLRYPKGKEEITGFMYESWHFRYLGVETAKEVYEAGVTLEEYLNID